MTFSNLYFYSKVQINACQENTLFFINIFQIVRNESNIHEEKYQLGTSESVFRDDIRFSD